MDEGIKGYRDEALEIAASNCKKLEIPHHIVSFKELYGFTLDEMIFKAREKGQTELTACAYCGVLGRKAINAGARQVKANKIATGHTLDDEVQTVLMNIFRGDIARLAKEKPVTSEVHPLFVQKIKPFCEIPEKESALYAYVKKIAFQDTPCPYASEALRNDMRGMLNRMEEKHAGTKFTVSKAIERLRPALEETAKKEDFKVCVNAVNLQHWICVKHANYLGMYVKVCGFVFVRFLVCAESLKLQKLCLQPQLFGHVEDLFLCHSRDKPLFSAL